MSFDGLVAVVTGAGNGLGRAYALEFARRGAKVVVNDLGGATDGTGAGSAAADKVVAEIKAAGGQAVANYDSVVDGAKVVQTAIDAFGRIDVLVNNAGILRDRSFGKMADKDWNLLYEVHLKGAYATSRAAWPHMRKQKSGRIIFVTSAAGIYGNRGQAGYSAVKAGVIGLANSLAIEGKSRNVFVNTIAPLAGSRMTATVMPPDLVKALSPEYVAPLVMYLSHPDCQSTGGVFEVGAGWVARLRWERSRGKFFPLSQPFSIEDVAEAMAPVISNFADATHPTSGQEAFTPIMANLATKDAPAPAPAASAPSAAGTRKTDAVDYERVMTCKVPESTFTYTERDSMLYALGIGCGIEPHNLRYVYEGHERFAAFPTYGVVVPSSALAGVMNLDGLNFNPMMLLHGEQYMEVKKPLAASGTLVNKPRVAGLYDKGKSGIVVLDVPTYDQTGAEVLFNQYTLFIRGIGGFGGPSGPKKVDLSPPKRAPDVVHRERTDITQAALYRLSGDMNPLHIDPNMAAMGGFDTPILHGLCSFGFAARAVLLHFADNDASRFKSIRVRFSKHVFPGESLVTEMWQVSPTRIIFRVRVAERGDYCLTNACIELFPDPAQAAAAAAASAAAPAAVPAGGFRSAAVFDVLASRVNAELVGKVQASYRFDVTGADGSKRQWLVDLKSGNGSVTESGAKADCMFIIDDANLVDLMTGKLNPMMAFTQGKVKIKGNMMLAQKLSLLLDQNKDEVQAAVAGGAGGAAAPAASSGPALKCDAIFNELASRVNAEIVGKVKASFRFDVTGGDGASKSWLVDLKSGNGKVVVGSPSDKADCVFIISDDDLVALMTGKLNAQMAFIQGKFKIKGNIMLAQKLGLLVAKEKAAGNGVSGSGASGSSAFKAEPIFAELGQRVNAELVSKVNAIFRFDLTNGSATRKWVVDLKNGSGSVKESDGNADCVLALSDDDFVDLMAGKLQAMTAFMQGKLKLKGNIMLAQKLNLLMQQQKAAGATVASAGASGSSAFKAEPIFAELGQRVNAELVSKVNAIFRFDLTNGTDTRKWVVDLKNGSGSVKESDGNADCVLALSDDDFVDLMAGKLQAMTAFMQGKLKLKGNIMLAQKLNLLMQQQKAAGATVASAGASGSSDFKAEAIFAELAKRVNASLVSKVNAVFRFELTSGSATRKWVVDLKNGSGSVKESDGKADCVLVLSDADFVDLMSGKLQAMSAFMQGKLKLKGNMMLAQKLNLLMQQRASL